MTAVVPSTSNRTGVRAAVSDVGVVGERIVEELEELTVIDHLDFSVPCGAKVEGAQPCPEEADYAGWCTSCGRIAVMLCTTHAMWVCAAKEVIITHRACGAEGSPPEMIRLVPIR